MVSPKMEESSCKSMQPETAAAETTLEDVHNNVAVLRGADVVSSENVLSISGSESASRLHLSSPGNLPTELISIILSKLSFPEIFQSKMLSKTWYSRLPSLRPVKSISSLVQDDHSFSILPELDVSSNWSTFCPVFVGRQEIVGYERLYNRWRKVPIHCDIPIQEQLMRVPYFGFIVNFAGPIMFVYRLGLEEANVLVANPILGRWTNLLGFPTVHESSCVCQVGPEQYKVVIHYPWQHSDGFVRFKTRVLDSKTKTWIRVESVHPSQVNRGVVDYGKNILFSAYLDGNVYCTLTSWWSKKLEIWQYTIEGGTWTNVPLDTRFEEFEFQTCGLYAVASQILLVTMGDKTYTSRHSTYYSQSARVYRLDMKSLKLSDPWKSPPMPSRFCSFNNSHSRVICDREYLYFVREIRRPGQGSFPIQMWSLHLTTESWSSIPTPPMEYSKICTFLSLADGAFAPGLNPRAAP